MKFLNLKDSAFLMRIPFVLFSTRKMTDDHHDDEQNDFSRIESFVLKFQFGNGWKLQKVFKKEDDEVVFDDDEMTTARSVFELFKMKFLIDDEEVF